MHYYSEKLKKDISCREILSYADTHRVGYIKAKHELKIKEVPTPKPTKTIRHFSKNDMLLLALYGLNILKLEI
jgi:hypothetical protein